MPDKVTPRLGFASGFAVSPGFNLTEPATGPNFAHALYVAKRQGNGAPFRRCPETSRS